MIDIILKKDVLGLGGEGDVKKVSTGYARNYLFPFKYAVPKTMATLKKLDLELHSIMERKKRKINSLQDLVVKLNNVTVAFEVNALKNGKLFGSISVHDIFQKLQGLGFDIKKNQIRLLKPIKFLGVYHIIVMVYAGLEAKVKISVVSTGKLNLDKGLDTNLDKGLENKSPEIFSDFSQSK